LTIPIVGRGRFRANGLLLGVGIAFFAVALVGLILNSNGVLDGTLFTLSAAFFLISVVEPRMVGQQHVFGQTLNLSALTPEERKRVTETEHDLGSGTHVISLDELSEHDVG